MTARHSLARHARRLARVPALTIVAAAALVIGCGASHSHSGRAAGGGRATASNTSPVTEIKANWLAFFAHNTAPARKMELLQNGQRFRQTIEAQSNSPLAQQASARVAQVTLTGPNQARVRYSLLLAGQAVLPGQVGTAIKSNGSWQVSDASFCALMRLEGSAPPACPKG